MGASRPLRLAIWPTSNPYTGHRDEAPVVGLVRPPHQSLPSNRTPLLVEMRHQGQRLRDWHIGDRRQRGRRCTSVERLGSDRCEGPQVRVNALPEPTEPMKLGHGAVAMTRVIVKPEHSQQFQTPLTRCADDDPGSVYHFRLAAISEGGDQTLGETWTASCSDAAPESLSRYRTRWPVGNT
jgi:hypothetical protein